MGRVRPWSRVVRSGPPGTHGRLTVPLAAASPREVLTLDGLYNPLRPGQAGLASPLGPEEPHFPAHAPTCRARRRIVPDSA